MQDEPQMPGSNPLGLDRVEREIRIQKLRREINEVTGGEMVSGKSSECDPELEEAFLENVLALETHGFVCPFDAMKCDGFSLPPPDELDDAVLTTKLWELIHALRARRLFLHSTDHLSDRELYAWLWRDGLREEIMGFGLPFGNCHLDAIGSGSDEHITLQMRYYADEEKRARWAADFPDFPMPPREQRPFDRDRHLPKPEYPV